MKRKWTKLIPLLAVTASLLTGCGGGGAANGSKSMMATDSAAPAAESSASSNKSMNGGSGVAGENYATADVEEIAAEDGADVTQAQEKEASQNPDSMTLLEEKLVYYCNLEIETLDYPATMTSIKDTITRYGGIIQSERESDSGHDWYYENYRKTSGTMRNYLEVRVPSKEYNNFLAELDGVGKVISKSTSVDNISQQYYDTTAQIEALRIQEKNLLGMLEKCETIEDMITVEQRLSEVQYELNNLQTTRRYMDMDVAYSYVNIGVTEVMEYRQDRDPVRRNTFADRLKNTFLSTGRGFLSFLEGLLFLAIRLSPYILIIAVICFVFFRDKIKRFREEQKIAKEERLARRAYRGQNGPDRMTLPPVPQNQNTGGQTPPAAPMPTGGQTPPAAPMPAREQIPQDFREIAGDIQQPYQENDKQ